MIIALEGINGVGKSTQVALLRDRLEAKTGAPVKIFSDPGVHSDHSAYHLLRPLARSSTWNSEMTRMMLYMAARCELAYELQQLPEGTHAILDRYMASYYAYGIDAFTASMYDGLPRGVSASFTAETPWNNITDVLRACGCPLPDLAVILSIDPVVAYKRCKQADLPDHYERDGIQRLSKIACNFDFLVAEHNKFRAAPYTNGTLDLHIADTVCAVELLSSDRIVETHEKIWRTVEPHVSAAEKTCLMK